MLVRFVPCKKCKEPFKRESHSNKVCPECTKKSHQEQTRVHTEMMQAMAKRDKPKTYTIVDKNEKLIGFLKGFNTAEIKGKLKKGQYIYKDPFACNYY